MFQISRGGGDSSASPSHKTLITVISHWLSHINYKLLLTAEVCIVYSN